MDTVGSIVDKLCTVNNKMFTEQEKLYSIRRGTFDDFKAKYMSEAGMKSLYDYFLKAADLNLQRNQFIDEIDQTLINMIQAYMDGEDLEEGGFVQRKHKTL